MPGTQKAPASKKKNVELGELEVLLVEDDCHTREMVKQVLKQAGIKTVHIAENGREAVNMLLAAQGSIHVALLDLDMPVMSGFTCLKVIRAAPKDFIAKLPIVILTAYAGLPQLEKAASLGISGFLSKPVSIKALTNAITKAVKGEIIVPALVEGLSYIPDRGFRHRRLPCIRAACMSYTCISTFARRTGPVAHAPMKWPDDW